MAPKRWQNCGYNSSDVPLASFNSEEAALSSKSSVETAHTVPTKDPLRCPLMSPEEVAAISVPLAEVESRLRQVLERYGAAIVTDVLNPEECRDLEELFAADLSDLIDEEAILQAGEEMQKIAANVKDWPLASAELLGQKDRCQLRGLPHSRFAWAGRLHPNVRRAYEVIHATKELVSSCDNSFFAPASHPEETSNRNWPHVDHNRHDSTVCDEDGVFVSDWEVYQGALYVWASDTTHASTTVLWCGSHTDVYDELMADPGLQKRGQKGNHFSRIVEDVKSEETSRKLSLGWRQSARRVPVPAGGMLLWSSKTVHQGWSGGPRLAQPVCWEPKGRRSDWAYEKKLRLAALGLPSTHWASLGIPHTLVNIEPSPPTKAGRKKNGVALPLKSSIRPPTLAEGVELQDMWQHFAKPDWQKKLSLDLRDILEKSVAPHIAGAL